MIAALFRSLRAGAAERTWLEKLAAPACTVTFFLLTAAGSLGVIWAELSATALMVAPFTLLLANLGAAIVTMPRFRRDLPLLVFHLTLLLLVSLFIASRLTYLDATTAVTRGETFQGALLTEERGPLHGERISEIRFTNLGFSEYYLPGSPFRSTRNQISWTDAEGRVRHVEIGNDRPLVIDGYRFYTTRVRGYTPLFRWTHPDGTLTMGQVQLNNAVETESPAVNEWRLPDGTRVWAMLDQSDGTPASFAPPDEKRSRINLDADRLQHRLVLRTETGRHELLPGETVAFEGGVLTYLGLEAWMGYQIVYDPIQPWLIATVVVGVLSLVWFYTRQLFRRGRWDSDR